MNVSTDLYRRTLRRWHTREFIVVLLVQNVPQWTRNCYLFNGRVTSASELIIIFSLIKLKWLSDIKTILRFIRDHFVCITIALYIIFFFNSFFVVFTQCFYSLWVKKLYLKYGMLNEIVIWMKIWLFMLFQYNINIIMVYQY